MNQELEPQKIEVNSSLMNLFDKSMLYTAFWPVDAFVDTVYEAGYSGLEWHPVRGIVAGIQMNNGLIREKENHAIRSLHQSFRSEKNISEVLSHPNRALAAVSYVLLPERIDSLRSLEQLQLVLGRKLPVVLYPPLSGEPSGTDRNFGECMIQPTWEVMHSWNAGTPNALVKEMLAHGYSSFCLDLFHLRQRSPAGADLAKWQDTLSWLLPHTSELHISVGRIDIPIHQVDTMHELRDLIAGKGNSELLHMLRMIASSGWRGRVVTEIPAVALHNLHIERRGFASVQNPRKERKRSSSVQNIIDDHKQIINTIKTYLV